MARGKIKELRRRVYLVLMYFIAAGEVEVALKKERLRLGVGQFFGEVAVLRRARRSATAIATTRTNLLVLDAQDLRALMSRDPRIARRIKDVVEKRVGREVVSPEGDCDGGDRAGGGEVAISALILRSARRAHLEGWGGQPISGLPEIGHIKYASRVNPTCGASRRVAGATLLSMRPIEIGWLGRHRLLQVLVHLVEEAGGAEPLLIGADQERQVLGHEA